MKKEVGPIKAIIFDVGGVLQLGERPKEFKTQLHISGIHARIAKKLKISLDQYFDSIDQYYVKSIEGKITKKELLKNISENLNYPPKKLEKLYFKLYKREFRVNKRLIKIAKKLKKQGFKVAILSDQWHLSKNAHLTKEMKKVFSPIIISCEVGARKPSIEVYELVLKKLKVKAHEAIFIDNQIWNLPPAKKLGIHTILFVNNKQTIHALREFGLKI